jgi:hypothetical protein
LISPHTLPGTKVVCIYNGPCKREWIAEGYVLQGPEIPISLQLGSVYVVEDIVKEPVAKDGCGVVIIGYPGSFPLQIFRYLDLPSSLTDKLSTKPVDQPSELEPA